MRDTDAVVRVVRVVRAFEDPAIPAPFDAVAPARAAANLGPESVPADPWAPEKPMTRLDADRARGRRKPCRADALPGGTG